MGMRKSHKRLVVVATAGAAASLCGGCAALDRRPLVLTTILCVATEQYGASFIIFNSLNNRIWLIKVKESAPFICISNSGWLAGLGLADD